MRVARSVSLPARFRVETGPNDALEIGTESNPLPASYTAEIIIKDKALDATTDPDQYGTGSLVVDGKVTMHGAGKSPTFVRLAAGASGWAVNVATPTSGGRLASGDRLILPDTRHLRDSEVRDWNVIQPQWEELTVQGVSADGHTLTLGRALTYDHFGARDGNGTLDFLPHVGNLYRNITIRSEFLIGTGIQGHTLFTSRANIDVRYVAFRSWTYAGSTHWLRKSDQTLSNSQAPPYGADYSPANGYQFTMIGNAIDGGSTTHKSTLGYGRA